jgi:hypothetical protein
MPDSNDQLLTLLASLSEKIDKLERSPALNGQFQILVNDVADIRTIVNELNNTLRGDANQEGLMSRVRQLENDNVDRKKFIEKVVEPGLREHERVVFKMEKFDELQEAGQEQSHELVLLKERVTNLNRIMWLMGTSIVGLFVKAVFNILSSV